MLDDMSVLLVCGQLALPNFGNASAALYNGTDFTPYILASTLGGQSGTLANLFTSINNPLRHGRKSFPMMILCLVKSLTSTQAITIPKASLCWLHFVPPWAPCSW